MKCQYCQAQVELDDGPHSNADVWICTGCKCRYRTTRCTTNIMSTLWFAYLDDKAYYLKSYNGCTGNAPEFIIGFHAQDIDGKWYWKEIKRFNFVPKDWTPLNSAHKLKMYLPFL